MQLLKNVMLGLGVLLSASLLADTHADYSEAEVRRVDTENQRVTLRHGPIDSLQMPPRTMVVRVDNADDLVGLSPGDQILFQAEERDGRYVVTRLRMAGDAATSAAPATDQDAHADHHGH